MKDGHAKCATFVHLILPRKQRLMKYYVLSRIAWTQNRDVMCANPVHLEHSRMQRLMKNSAMSPAPPRAEDAYGGRIYICKLFKPTLLSLLSRILK
jgi:hypothetical protein